MAKLRSVLMGTGGWARAHAAAYGNCAEVELVGVCGHSDVERLDQIAEGNGIPERSLDLVEMLEKTKPDILDIACNPHFRLEGVKVAMRPYIKLINVEKPLSLTPGDAYEIEKLCKESGKLLTVNHQKKFLPAWKKAKEFVASGGIGETGFIRASCQGNLLEQGTHLVDMALFFNDYNPVSWVMGQIDELEGLDKPAASAPDSAMAIVCAENGVRSVLTFGSMGHEVPGSGPKWYHFTLEAYGSEGHVKVGLNTEIEMTSYADGKTVTEESSWTKDFLLGLTRHLDAVAQYAKDPAQGHWSNLDNSMQSFQVIMGIYASGCGDGRVGFPRRFDNQLMDRLQRLRE